MTSDSCSSCVSVGHGVDAAPPCERFRVPSSRASWAPLSRVPSAAYSWSPDGKGAHHDCKQPVFSRHNLHRMGSRSARPSQSNNRGVRDQPPLRPWNSAPGIAAADCDPTLGPEVSTLTIKDRCTCQCLGPMECWIMLSGCALHGVGRQNPNVSIARGTPG